MRLSFPEIICVESGDEQMDSAIKKYWSLNDEGKFKFSVKEITAEFSVSPSMFKNTAYFKGVPLCEKCSKPLEYLQSRGHYSNKMARMATSISDTVCDNCVEAYRTEVALEKSLKAFNEGVHLGLNPIQCVHLLQYIDGEKKSIRKSILKFLETTSIGLVVEGSNEIIICEQFYQYLVRSNKDLTSKFLNQDDLDLESALLEIGHFDFNFLLHLIRDKDIYKDILHKENKEIFTGIIERLEIRGLVLCKDNGEVLVNPKIREYLNGKVEKVAKIDPYLTESELEVYRKLKAKHLFVFPHASIYVFGKEFATIFRGLEINEIPFLITNENLIPIGVYLPLLNNSKIIYYRTFSEGEDNLPKKYASLLNSLKMLGINVITPYDIIS